MQIKKLVYLSCLFFGAYVCAEQVKVINQSGNTSVWGATYYLFKNYAQREGDVQRVADEIMFSLPQLKTQGARYLIIAREQQALRNVINDPFGTVGVRLIAIGQTDTIGPKKIVVLQVEDLPEA